MFTVKDQFDEELQKTLQNAAKIDKNRDDEKKNKEKL